MFEKDVTFFSRCSQFISLFLYCHCSDAKIMLEMLCKSLSFHHSLIALPRPNVSSLWFAWFPFATRNSLIGIFYRNFFSFKLKYKTFRMYQNHNRNLKGTKENKIDPAVLQLSPALFSNQGLISLARYCLSPSAFPLPRGETVAAGEPM